MFFNVLIVFVVFFKLNYLKMCLICVVSPNIPYFGHVCFLCSVYKKMVALLN